MLKKSIEGKKGWLANIKMARTLYSDRQQIQDEFNTNQALKEWIGLPSKQEQLELMALSFNSTGSKIE